MEKTELPSLLDRSRSTIESGIREIEQFPVEAAAGFVRRLAGGRSKTASVCAAARNSEGF
jgi:hypothetical protein